MDSSIPVSPNVPDETELFEGTQYDRNSDDLYNDMDFDLPADETLRASSRASQTASPSVVEISPRLLNTALSENHADEIEPEDPLWSTDLSDSDSGDSAFVSAPPLSSSPASSPSSLPRASEESSGRSSVLASPLPSPVLVHSEPLVAPTSRERAPSPHSPSALAPSLPSAARSDPTPDPT